jgi:hypothetical protein
VHLLDALGVAGTTLGATHDDNEFAHSPRVYNDEAANEKRPEARQSFGPIRVGR